MIFLKSYRNEMKRNSGFLIVDIIVASCLAILFVVIMFDALISTDDIFNRAKSRSQSIDAYVSSSSYADALSPYESYHSESFDSSGTWYGNDRIEVDSDLSGIRFGDVHARAMHDYFDFAGTPLCSVDFSDESIMGSFGQSSEVSDSKLPDALKISVVPITLPINPSLPLTFLVVRDGIAYLAADPATSSDPDLILADIHDPSRVSVVSSVHSGPGLSMISIAGNRIFGSSLSSAAQLNIIRLDLLSNPIIEQKYRLPQSFATATMPLASSIFFDKGYVYLGTDKWDGQEFDIIDVTKPGYAVKVGGLEIGSKINDIYVRDGIAYIADSDEEQFRVIDVRDPLHPFEISHFSPSGSGRQTGKAVSFFENGLNIGRTSGGYNIVSDHELFAFSTTSSTTLASNESIDIPGGVYGRVTDRTRIYSATRQFGSELEIYDRILDAVHSRQISIPVIPQMMTCDRNMIYILSHTTPVIYQISF